MERLRLVPLDDTVVFPSMTVTLPVDVAEDDRVFLVPRHGGDYASVGVVAEVVDRVRLPGGGRAIVLSGLHRGVAGAARNDPAGHLVVEVEAKPDETPPRSAPPSSSVSTAPWCSRYSSFAATTGGS